MGRDIFIILHPAGIQALIPGQIRHGPVVHRFSVIPQGRIPPQKKVSRPGRFRQISIGLAIYDDLAADRGRPAAGVEADLELGLYFLRRGVRRFGAVDNRRVYCKDHQPDHHGQKHRQTQGGHPLPKQFTVFILCFHPISPKGSCCYSAPLMAANRSSNSVKASYSGNCSMTFSGARNRNPALLAWIIPMSL